MTFAVLIWLIYEAVVHGRTEAYCQAKPFLTPFFILAFSILGLFLGGWAAANWDVPSGLPFSGLAFKAGGAVAFFLIAAVVTTIMSADVPCSQTLAYKFWFGKPEIVSIRPDNRYDDRYQTYAVGSTEAKGVLFYSTAEALSHPQDLRLKFVVGNDELVCPINVRIHNSYESFDEACHHQMVTTSDIGFTLSDETRSYATKLANQGSTNAPIEAAVGGEAVAGNAPNQPADKDCFAEIWAGKLVPPPYRQKFNSKSNLGQGGHVVLHLYRGEVCLEDGNHNIIYPRSSSSLRPSWLRLGLLHSIVPSAHAEGADSCQSSTSEGATFDRLIKQLASEDPEKANLELIANFRRYECNIYDLLLAPEIAPSLAARLLRVITVAPVGWSNAKVIANDKFPDLRPVDKAKRVFDRAIESFIISENDDLRFQARKMLTSYPVTYVRDKFGEIDIDRLSELQRFYFSYAGIFIYFRPVISGEYFDKDEMTTDLMSKIVAEYRKGIALRRYLDGQDLVDSYILDFGLGSSVRNFEKSDKAGLVPDKFKPSQMVFRTFLDGTRASPETYPFNNQLGWATCFAYTPSIESLKLGPDNKPLTLDDAEWFKGEGVKVDANTFILNAPGSTTLKACPGRSYRDTDWTVEEGDVVHRLLRKRGDEDKNWLFVRTIRGFGWLEEQPKTAAAKVSDEPAPQ